MSREAMELLPCPFCGSDAMFTIEQREGHPDFGGQSAACGTCGAGVGYIFACGDDPKPLLAEAWNRRAALAAPEQQAGTVQVPVEPSQQYWDDVWKRISADGHIKRTASVVQIKRLLDVCHAAMLAAAQTGEGKP